MSAWLVAQCLGQIAVGSTDLAIRGVLAQMRRRMQYDTGVPDQQSQQDDKTKFSTDYRHVGYDHDARESFTAR